MPKFIDSAKYDCYICGHKWKIRSDKLITDDQYVQWILDINKENILIHRERSK